MTFAYAIKSLRHSDRGASFTEYGILLSLISVLGIGSVVLLGGTVGANFETAADHLSIPDKAPGSEAEDEAEAEPDADELGFETTECLEGTDANDVFGQLGTGISCIHLFGGDDTLDTVIYSGLEVWPGTGNDYLELNGGGAVIHYEGGDDYYVTDFPGTSLDLSRYALADLSFRTGALNPQNTKKKGWLSYDIVTPDGRLRIENGMIGASGTTYGIQSFTLSEGEIDQGEIRQMVLDGQVSDGRNEIYGTELADVMVGGPGNQKVYLAEGADDYTWVSGNEIIDASQGADRIRFQGWSYADVAFDIDRRDLRVKFGGTQVTLDDQARYMIGDPNVLFVEFVFEDKTVGWPELALRAVADQGVNGEKLLEGTAYDDTLRPTVETRDVNPVGGDDRIVYTGGSFRIYGDSSGFFLNPGQDTLDMSAYASSDMTVIASGADIYITAPDGEIKLDNQVLFAAGQNPNLTIDRIEFSDVVWQEADIRAAAGL